MSNESVSSGYTENARRKGVDAPNVDGSLLSVRDLSVAFGVRGQPKVRAVDEVSFRIRPGEHVGLVGESGSGKSVTSLAIMGLLPKRAVQIGGEVLYNNENLLELAPNKMTALRGRDIAMVFQDPMTSLNPVIPVGTQVGEIIERHFGVKKKESRNVAGDLLAKVGIPDPVRRLKEYPHQLSGGMRQRVMIAMALACEPRLLIADEPTTALDVTIQAQILELLKLLVAETGAALLMITHDLGVVAGLCDRVHVMYSGKIVERASAEELFANPQHPYTEALLASIPRLDEEGRKRLANIPGLPPDLVVPPPGCSFHPRCRFATEKCWTVEPTLTAHDGQ